MYKLTLWIFLAVFCAHPVWAGEVEDISKIKERLVKLAPQEQPDSIRSTAVPGLYEVVFDAEVFYISANGRYVVQGALLDLEENINLTESARTGIRNSMLKQLDESSMIVFSPKNPRYTLTVFTDIDCGYCRKFHVEMDELHSYGIKVRYMMFPRTGMDTPSSQKAVSVWCAEDQQASLTKAKAGEDVPSANCDNPIASQWLMGLKMGVNGTPALLLEDGSLMPGYRPAKELAAMLDANAKAN